MAAFKRSHNKKHLCVSCGQVRGKFHTHVISCRGASKGSASDLLSEEHARVDKLRLISYHVSELQSAHGRRWPEMAYTLVKIGIPIITGNKKAVSSIEGLVSYIDTNNLGKLALSIQGLVSFQSVAEQVSNNPISQSTNLISDQTQTTNASTNKSGSITVVPPMAATGLNKTMHTQSVCEVLNQGNQFDETHSSQQMSGEMPDKNNDPNCLGMEQHLELPSKNKSISCTSQQQMSGEAAYMDLHGESDSDIPAFIARPLRTENVPETSGTCKTDDIHNTFKEIDNQAKQTNTDSPVKTIRKRKRITVTSPDSDTSPWSNVRTPDFSPPLVTRSKSERNKRTKLSA